MSFVRIFLFKTSPNRDSKKNISSLAHKFVYDLACKELGADVIIGTGEFGKPFIIGHDEWQFNISHTEGLLTVAISNMSIGIDVENVQQANMSVAKRFFTHEEYAYIELDADHQHERFMEVWTKKESYLKYVGAGLHHPLNSINVIGMQDFYNYFFIDKWIVCICQKNCEGYEVINI